MSSFQKIILQPKVWTQVPGTDALTKVSLRSANWPISIQLGVVAPPGIDSPLYVSGMFLGAHQSGGFEAKQVGEFVWAMPSHLSDIADLIYDGDAFVLLGGFSNGFSNGFF